MSAETVAIEIGLAAAQLAYNAYHEKYDGETLAEKFIELGLTFFPRASLAKYLTKGGVEAGELAADIAEDVKFGPETTR